MSGMLSVREILIPENREIQLISHDFQEQGIWFGDIHCQDIEAELRDYTIKETELMIQMKTPITVYSTDDDSGNSYSFTLDDDMLCEKVNDNFWRKYYAYYVVMPASEITLEPNRITAKDKFVTHYKQSYIYGWYGSYRISGKTKVP